MKIYFACSITGGRQDETVYQSIVKTLLDGGHQVPTAHLANSDVVSKEHMVDPHEVYTRDIDWINNSDALIAEVSTPSHGVGYEIGYALSISKPVLCCFLEGTKISKMLIGNSHPLLDVRSYTNIEHAKQIVHTFLDALA